MNEINASKRLKEAAAHKAEADKIKLTKQAEAEAEAEQTRQRSIAETMKLQAENAALLLAERAKSAAILEQHPALLRLAELEAMQSLATNAKANLYIGVDGKTLRT